MSGLSLNLGSGRDWREDCVNADIKDSVRCDWMMDVCDIKWGRHFKCRFGFICIRPGIFEKIVANDVLEHVSDLVKCMTNCKELLTEDGEMHIRVPYDLSYGAWQDPTHVRAFNEKSWLYYCEWSSYIGWKDRFDLVSMDYCLSDLGQSLELPQEELVRTPRAVDALQLVLKKRKGPPK